MEPETNDEQLNRQLAERFAALPKVVQEAITSADVQKHMRDLADTHKLHVDQWQLLENNVMLSVLGFQPVAELAQELEKDLGITAELATELTAGISKIVFEPIRHEMEEHLGHPTAIAVSDDLETLRDEAVAGAKAEVPQNTPPSAPVVPATPPPSPPTEKAVRGEIAPTYTASASHERKTIEGDPYREQLK